MSGISVAMGTFNGELFLPEQLDSIAQQTLSPRELVVCDDGSTDRSLQILENFAGRASFPVRLLRNPGRLGVTRNFAQCIQRCTGDLIALADQDDRWAPQKLAHLAPLFSGDPSVLCAFSNGTVMDEASRPLGQESWARFLFTPALQRQMLSGDAPGVLLKVPVVSGAAMMIRSALKPHVACIPPGWVHDTWLAWMAALGGRLVPLPEPLIHYRIHPSQQLGLAAETGRQRLRRLGTTAFLADERTEAVRQYEHMARSYAGLAAYVEEHPLGAPEIHRLIREKAAFAARARRLLETPRLLRLLPSLALARDFHRFSPRGLETLLRHAVL